MNTKHLRTATRAFGLRICAAFTAGAILAAADSQRAWANDFSNITGNITDSTATLPNLLATVAYVGGCGLGITGIFKLKSHVDAPQQTPMREGLVRMGAGGGLLAYPMVMEAMANTIGTGGTTPTEVISGSLNTLSF